MNPTEAKTILLAYRPDVDPPAEGKVAEALTLVRADPALRDWFERQTQFHAMLRRSFRAAPVPPVPAGLVERLRARAPARRPVFWRHPAWSAAAACLALLLGLTIFWRVRPAEDSFATFRSRMVRSVLRQYTMDIVTNDMNSIRQFLNSRQAPADFVLPPGLASLPASGAGVLSWQEGRASMVCLDSPDQGTLFLFVVNQSAVHPSPPDRPEFVRVSKLTTASWTRDGKAYVLAGTGGPEVLQKRF